MSVPLPVVPATTVTPAGKVPPSLEPGPTATVPPGTEVYIQVSKDPTSGAITFLFSGGPGQKVVRSIDVNVIREDGSVLRGTLKPVINDEAVLQGTWGGTDRVQVMVTYLSGSSYTIVDRQLKRSV